MSMRRSCPNCFRKENERYNFGESIENETAYHQEKCCDCGYKTPEEMMQDQDLGFFDPNWVPIAKYFLENYHNSISQGIIQDKDEQTRFFLKLLKSAANSRSLSLELVEKKENEDYEFIFEGKTKHNPKINIFDTELNLYAHNHIVKSIDKFNQQRNNKTKDNSDKTIQSTNNKPCREDDDLPF
jgi:hypothetical protein